MPLILLKTEKNVIYGILHRKNILWHEKVVFYKMYLNVQKWILFTVSEKEIVYSFYFLVIKTLKSIEDY